MEKIVPKLPIVRSEVRAYVAYTEGRLGLVECAAFAKLAKK